MVMSMQVKETILLLQTSYKSKNVLFIGSIVVK